MGSTWIIDNLSLAVSIWNKALQQIWNLLSITPEQFSPSIWETIIKLNKALQGIGMGLLVLFFVSGFFRTAENFSELKRPETVLRCFGRFAVARLLVTYGMELVLAVFKIVQGIIRTIMQTASIEGASEVTVPESLIQAVEGSSLLDGMGLWILTLIGCIAVFAITFMLVMTVYGRIFKLYICLILAPIPLSSFAAEQHAGMGRNYLKGFAGVCMEGAVIMICCLLYTMLSNTTVVLDPETGANIQLLIYLYYLLFNMLILLGTVKASDRIVKELLF